jgi:hypothetical protein
LVFGDVTISVGDAMTHNSLDDVDIELY